MNENNHEIKDKENNTAAENGENRDAEMSNAMRVLAGTGKADENLYESKIAGRKIGRAENFWYRHKWHAGLIIFAFVAAVVVLWQFFTNVTPDAYIVYCGPQAFVGRQYDAFDKALGEVMGDYNNDGKKKISLADNTYLSEEQINELKAKNSSYSPDYSANSAALMRYRTEIAAGKHMFCMLDPALYGELRDADGFVPLTEIFGEDAIPGSAVDEYGIRLGDTEFYRYYSEVQFIPADTVLAVRSTAALDFKSDEKKTEYQEAYKQLLTDIVSFVPEK